MADGYEIGDLLLDINTDTILHTHFLFDDTPDEMDGTGMDVPAWFRMERKHDHDFHSHSVLFLSLFRGSI